MILGAVYGIERLNDGLWLGNELGVIFLCYLIGLIIVAAIREYITDRRFSTQDHADVEQPNDRLPADESDD